MKTHYLRISAACLFVAGILIIGIGTRKTVTVVINGEKNVITAYQWRVGGLLARFNLSPSTGDRISLSPSTWLVNQDVIRFDQAAAVLIYADGDLTPLLSVERIPANLLAGAGVRIYPGDQVLVNGNLVDPAEPLAYNDVFRIQVDRAIQLQVTDSALTFDIRTTAPTIGQALAEQKMTMHASDWVSQGFDSPLVEDFIVDYRPARIVHLQSQTGADSFYSAAPTIGAALVEHGLALQGLDYTQPAMFEPIPENGQVRLTRVSEAVIMEQEPIAFETALEPAPDVELDQRVTLQPGEYGLLARRVRVRSEDGVEISRKAEAEWVAQPVKNKIVGYGTKIVIKTLNTPDGPIEYWRSISMYATSYSPCRIFKDRCDSYTASGAELKKGIVAMRGYWYRYYGGTQVYVPGYGVGTVADVGGGIPGQFWIDLGYSDQDYVSWHQMVTVYFLTPVPDQIPYIVQ